jgi:hypothetical protein
MASSKSIVDLRKEIKGFIEQGFLALGLRKPYIRIGALPSNSDALSAIAKEAKGKADNGYIHLACQTISHETSSSRPMRQGLRAELVYFLYIWSNDRTNDEELIRLWETTRDILFRKLGFIYEGEFPPMQYKDSGLFMALLAAGELNTYDGEGYFPLRRSV